MAVRALGISLCVIGLAATAATAEPTVTDRPRGTYVVTTMPPVPAGIMPHAGRIIYMNRQGGTYYPGNNDASTNSSSIPSSVSVIQPWSGSESEWQDVMDCMVRIYEPFDILITDVDPGAVAHVESVVAGYPQDIGMSQGVGGVSPFACGPIERSIAFTFAEVYSSPRDICETAAQETAHSYGLDHQLLCSDPLTYLSDCGAKAFQDEDVACGEYEERACDCGGNTQNSYQLLLELLGPAQPSGSPDAGVSPPSSPDASLPVPPGVDASVPTVPDAAVPPAPRPDAAVPPVPQLDAGVPQNPTDDPDSVTPQVVGGCTTAGGGGSTLLFICAGWPALRRRRRRSATR